MLRGAALRPSPDRRSSAGFAILAFVLVTSFGICARCVPQSRRQRSTAHFAQCLDHAGFGGQPAPPPRVVFLCARLLEATSAAVSHAAPFLAAPGLSPPGVAACARQFVPNPGVVQKVEAVSGPPRVQGHTVV